VHQILQVLNESENKPKITVMTGFDFGITDVGALRALQKIENVNCRISCDKNFHPKLYIFEKDDDYATISVGSSNLSEGGLSTNYEANLTIEGKVTETPIIKQAIDYFSFLFSISAPFDEKSIESYVKAKHKKETDENIEKMDKTFQNSMKEVYENLSKAKEQETKEKKASEQSDNENKLIIRFDIQTDHFRGKYLQVLKDFRQYFPPIGVKFVIIDSLGYKHHDVKLEGKYRITGLEKKGDNLKFFVGSFQFAKVIYMKVIEPYKIYQAHL
jgi:phosphatidylserine/phosphatidylglycerophosphate/cardiolipin synthase-like enzyme